MWVPGVTSSTHWSLEVQSLFCFEFGGDQGLGCSVSAAAWEDSTEFIWRRQSLGHPFPPRQGPWTAPHPFKMCNLTLWWASGNWKISYSAPSLPLFKPSICFREGSTEDHPKTQAPASSFQGPHRPQGLTFNAYLSTLSVPLFLPSCPPVSPHRTVSRPGERIPVLTPTALAG